MEELIWLARGVVASGVGLGILAVLLPDRILGVSGIALDRRTLGFAGIVAIVGGAILVAIAAGA